MHRGFLTCLISFVALLFPLPMQAADMAGSGDHPAIPRVAGAEVIGYAQAPYDAGNFLVENESGKAALVQTEGRRTRLLYANKSGDTPLMVQRNYEVALDELGRVQELYACKADCVSHTLATTFWSRQTMIPTEGLEHPFYLLGFSHVFTTPTYRYAQVSTSDAEFHVGVLSAVVAAGNSNTNMRGRTVTLVEIVEKAAFEATLEFVDAKEMQDQIGAIGHVALYGIQFDHDDDSLREESRATLDEIAKVLKADSELALYVVGHTDDAGALAYNQDLSLRRARSVVQALTDRGLATSRLIPIGVGPAAPVGSNDSEEGRALNRRVVLVKRK